MVATLPIPYHDYIFTPNVILVVATFFSFLFSFAMGANDSANSLGTAVGSKSISLRKALLIGGLFEGIGTVLLGAAVSDTIRKSIIDLDTTIEWRDFAAGMLCVLIGGFVFILGATFLNLPVSTTHAVVSATAGWSVVYKGDFSSLNMGKLGTIAASWVLSPVFGGLCAYLMYKVVEATSIKKDEPSQSTQRMMPVYFGVTIFILSMFITVKAFPDEWNVSMLVATIMAVVISIVSTVVFYFTAMKKYKHRYPKGCDEDFPLEEHMKPVEEESEIEVELSEMEDAEEAETVEGEEKEEHKTRRRANSLLRDKDVLGYGSNSDSDSDSSDEEDDNLKVAAHAKFTPGQLMFIPLQVIASFAQALGHGANDAANALAPLGAIVGVWQTESIELENAIPMWATLLTATGIIIGLLVLGHRVIGTIGEGIASVCPRSGFVASFASTLMVLIGSALGLPLSSSHILTGSVVGVSIAKGVPVKWKLVGSIGISWIVTLPASAAATAGFYALIKLGQSS
ncbi:hypothetical protein PCE1_000847 [Barthelona sp. PCE]